MAQLNDHRNIGQIYDINKVELKQYADDGCLYTCQVATYPPNTMGLYNMAGNVSEWTSNQGYVSTYDFENKKFKTLTSEGEIEKELENLHQDNDLTEADVKLAIDWLTQNKKVFKRDNIKICKGGSWADGLVYSLFGCRQGVGKENASTKIGFRIALSILDQELIKYLPKKNWEPEKSNKK